MRQILRHFPQKTIMKITMQKTTLAAFAAIAVAGFSGLAPAPFVLVPAVAAQATSDVAELAKNFDPAKNLDLSGEEIAYRLPAGISAKIVGTTYKQLVSFDGKIRRPISPKTTKLTFELSDASGATARTPTFEVSVPVSADFRKPLALDASRNAKPAVVPAIQEWFGGEGAFVPSEDFAIVVPAECANIGNPTLRARAELFAQELSEIFGQKIEVVDAPRRGKSDIAILLVNATQPQFKEFEMLGKEAYGIFSASDGLSIAASDPQGAFWGTRTVLQVFKQNGNAFPCGVAVDYPQYPLRGFSYDVGRKPASLKAVKDALKLMSYYKLNDYKIHLNDNLIWMYDFVTVPDGNNASPESKAQARKEVFDAAPTAFRLESDVVGKDGTPLTATDLYYTKKEFGELIDLAKLYGVNIVPEFETPGHAMSLVRVRPDLMYRGALTKPHDVERTAMLDASNEVFDPKTGRTFREETLDFVQSVFDEYLVGKNGEEPVFRDVPVVHIGTDEYYGNSEDYRAYADAMLKYMKSRGRTPRIWGSLSHKTGNTPVDGNGAQVDVWNYGWQTPDLALRHGFDLINIIDVTSYIVPSGTGSVGGYCDLLNLPYLYSQNWQPHKMDRGSVVPGHPKLLGAEWAIWFDNAFCRDTGLTDYDVFDRIRKNCAVFAEKTWNTGEDADFTGFMNLVKKVGNAPLSNPEYVLPADENGVLFAREERVPAGTVVETGIAGVAPDYVAEFRVKRPAGTTQPQVLFSGPTGKFLAVQEDTGKVGVVRDTWSYSFDYTLPEDREVELKIVAKGRTLSLFADGREIGGITRHKFPKSHKFSTYVFPLEKIGDAENRCEISALKITRLAVPGTENAVPAENFRSLSASSEHGQGADGDVSMLADGDPATYWHSRYAPEKDLPPFQIIVELDSPTELCAFAFLPRQDSDNGNVRRAGVFLKNGNGDWVKAGEFHGNGSSRELQKISFPPKTATAVKFLILDGTGGFGTIAEIYPIKSVPEKKRK